MPNFDFVNLFSPRYFKVIDNGYLVSIGTGPGGEEIAAQEYDEIMALIATKPEAPEDYDYRLTETLEWEQYELPPAPDPMDEVLDAATAAATIMEVVLNGS